MMKNFILGLFHKLGFSIIRITTLLKLREQSENGEIWDFVTKIPTNKLNMLVKYISKSNSELRQDIFVLNELDFKENGYFVEFGATDGVTGSNTYLLEKEFGWKGLLAEPARFWHESLKSNRLSTISTDCVWKITGEQITFSESKVPSFSTISHFVNSDLHSKTRKNSGKYIVNSISLIDLLDINNAPKNIDYLSIDTEGSELEILSAFDFSKYHIKVITVEHNFTNKRNLIYRLLSDNGFTRVFEEFSKYDDWYINRSDSAEK
jgi:FkbM family methyltransferase